MKAIQFTQPEEINLVDIPEPIEPGPGEALVRTHRMGICGTDLSGYLGKMPFFSYPRIPGHELGLEVLAVGELEAVMQLGDWLRYGPPLAQVNEVEELVEPTIDESAVTGFSCG